MEPSYDDVATFLRDFKVKKNTIANNFLFWSKRPKNTQSIADLGFSRHRVEEIIDALLVEDYVQGPIPDSLHNLPPLWVFGKIVDKQEIYIKLSLGMVGGPVVCISFHIADHSPMVYPFKSNT